jgi:hypothetical protein
VDYVDWVQTVLDGFLAARRLPQNQYSDDKLMVQPTIEGVITVVIGVPLEEIGSVTGFSDDDLVSEEGKCKPRDAIIHALGDLSQLGIVDIQGDTYAQFYQITQRGREIAEAGLKSIWGEMVDTFLADEQLQVLKTLAELGQQNKGTYVCLRQILLSDIAQALGPDWDENRIFGAVRDLEPSLILIRRMGEGGPFGLGNRSAYPTYRGIVRVTRQVDTHWQAKLRMLLAEWETINVDFKRELNLNPPTEKAEFAKDVIALANTKSSGERFMVIGFDDKTRAFHLPVHPGVSPDRLEDILNERVEPFPKVTYHTVNWESSTVSIIEIEREPYKLPYKAKKDMMAKSGAIAVENKI